MTSEDRRFGELHRQSEGSDPLRAQDLHDETSRSESPPEEDLYRAFSRRNDAQLEAIAMFAARMNRRSRINLWIVLCAAAAISLVAAVLIALTLRPEVAGNFGGDLPSYTTALTSLAIAAWTFTFTIRDSRRQRRAEAETLNMIYETQSKRLSAERDLLVKERGSHRHSQPSSQDGVINE